MRVFTEQGIAMLASVLRSERGAKLAELEQKLEGTTPSSPISL
jgi:hypothetical protein